MGSTGYTVKTHLTLSYFTFPLSSFLLPSSYFFLPGRAQVWHVLQGRREHGGDSVGHLSAWPRAGEKYVVDDDTHCSVCACGGVLCIGGNAAPQK